MNQSIGSIMNGGRTLLVRSLRGLRLLVGRGRRLLRVRWRVWVVHEVSGRCEACRIGLSWGILWLSRLALCLGRKDRIWEGRRSCRVGTAIRESRSVIVQVQVEPIAVVVVVLHYFVNLLVSVGVDRGGICMLMAFLSCVGVHLYNLATPPVGFTLHNCGETPMVSLPQVCSI